jgi:hypothetical protein
LRGELQNIQFSDFCRLLREFGFAEVRTRGSHRFFAHPLIPEVANLQDFDGETKPYQIRQFLKLVERYNLKLKR